MYNLSIPWKLLLLETENISNVDSVFHKGFIVSLTA